MGAGINVHNAASPRRHRVQRIVRQVHVWVGAWGALAAILFGVSGFLQNHRAILKLPQGDSTEISKHLLDVPEAARATPDALRDWLRDAQHVPIDSVRTAGGGRWLYSGGNARVTWNAEYTPGSPTVEVRNSEQSPLTVISRLHKGVGGGVAWILLTDSFAIAMALLGVSGIVLWARGRSVRQIAFSALGAALLALLLIGGSALL